MYILYSNKTISKLMSITTVSVSFFDKNDCNLNKKMKKEKKKV